MNSVGKPPVVAAGLPSVSKRPGTVAPETSDALPGPRALSGFWFARWPDPRPNERHEHDADS